MTIHSCECKRSGAAKPWSLVAAQQSTASSFPQPSLTPAPACPYTTPAPQTLSTTSTVSSSCVWFQWWRSVPPVLADHTAWYFWVQIISPPPSSPQTPGSALQFINLCCWQTLVCWLRTQTLYPVNFPLTRFQFYFHQHRAMTTTQNSLQVISHNTHRAAGGRNSPKH